MQEGKQGGGVVVGRGGGGGGVGGVLQRELDGEQKGKREVEIER